MVDVEGIGVTDVDALEPEVGDNVLADVDIVTMGIIDGADSIVTAVEYTTVNGDEVVVVAQQDEVGIG